MIDIPTTITTAAQTYTPPSGSIVLPSKTYFGQRGEYDPVPLVQYDDTLPIIAAALYLNGQPYTVPDGAAVNIRMAKGDGTYVYNPALGVSEDRQTAYIAVTYQMTVIAGNYCPILELVVSGDVAGTSELPLQIAENPVPEDAIASTDEYKTIQQLAAEVQEAAAIITENEQAIQDIENNLDAIQGAAGNAQSAAASAALAQQYASSIKPANFATAEQGAKADTAVQPSDILNLIYPVGAIYISYNSTSPATLFGGSWTRIQGCFLLSASEGYPVGSEGGEVQHKLTQAELPAYQLSVTAGENLVKSRTGSDPAAYTATAQSGWGLPNWNVVSVAVASGGSDQPHNNMPPYLAVYMWRRTA